MRLPNRREPALWPGLGLGLASTAAVSAALFGVHGSRATPALALVLPVVLAGTRGERLMEEANRLALLERVDEQRAALLRSVSHDLRTPLATIRAVTSDIRAGAGYDDATRDELLELVADEAERLDRLVANLLSLSR